MRLRPLRRERSRPKVNLALWAAALVCCLGAAATVVWGDADTQRIYGRGLILLGGGFAFVAAAKD